MHQHPRRPTLALLTLAALLQAGCAVIEVASDQGCRSYVVLGFAWIDLRADGRDAALAHVSRTQIGLYGQAGAGAHAGIGYVSARTTVAQPGAAGTVEATQLPDGSERVRVATTHHHAPEGGPHANDRSVVCLRGGLAARRLRE